MFNIIIIHKFKHEGLNNLEITTDRKPLEKLQYADFASKKKAYNKWTNYSFIQYFLRIILLVIFVAVFVTQTNHFLP